MPPDKFLLPPNGSFASTGACNLEVHTDYMPKAGLTPRHESRLFQVKQSITGEMCIKILHFRHKLHNKLIAYNICFPSMSATRFPPHDVENK